MFAERTGLIIWTKELRSTRALERHGMIHYVSKKMNYVVMYINSDRMTETMRHLEKLNFVKRIERSYRHDIKTEYSSNVPEGTQFYTY